MVQHYINLINNNSIGSKTCRISQRQNEILKIEIQRMLKLEAIEVGKSDYMSHVILVEEPGKYPLLRIDYRKLNEII